MKNQINELFYGKNNLTTALLVVAMLAFVGFACKSGGKSDAKPIPAAFLGDWEGQDGSTLSLRADSTGDYRSGSTKVEGGTAEVNEAEKTVSVKFFGIGKTLKVDEPPQGDQMKLDGIIYRRKGGFGTSTATTTTSTNATNTTSGTPTSSTTNTAKTTSATRGGDAPPDAEVETLVKETMEDFADAVESEDFANFHANTSKDFQVSYTPAQLNTTFAAFINNKAQAMPSLNTVGSSRATFTDGPRIRTEKGYKILVANGSLSTTPRPVQFETEYELERGAWKILKIKVKM